MEQAWLTDIAAMADWTLNVKSLQSHDDNKHSPKTSMQVQ